MKVKRLSIMFFLLVIGGCSVSGEQLFLCEELCKTNGGINFVRGYLLEADCTCVNGLSKGMLNSIADRI